MKDLINKNSAELMKMLAEKREELRVFRFGIVGSKVRNMRLGRDTRRVIARILTVINQK